MSNQRDKLRSSEPAAQAAKDAFASKYVAGRDDLAVGLGLNQSGSNWAMKVFAQSLSAAGELPDHFGDFDVEVKVSGRAKAF